MDKIGVIHGRFQPLHIGHMEYLLAGKARCEYLIVGISNPDVIMTKFTEANPHRSALLSNPLTYFERFQMTAGALLEAGLKRSEFDIVPFPINFPDSLFNYVPRDAKYYMTIYDAWSVEKQKSLETLGCDIEILWTRTNDEKSVSGTEIRTLIAANKPWEHLVPPYVYQYVINHQLDLRLRSMFRENG